VNIIFKNHYLFIAKNINLLLNISIHKYINFET